MTTITTKKFGVFVRYNMNTQSKLPRDNIVDSLAIQELQEKKRKKKKKKLIPFVSAFSYVMRQILKEIQDLQQKKQQKLPYHVCSKPSQTQRLLPHCYCPRETSLP